MNEKNNGVVVSRYSKHLSMDEQPIIIKVIDP